MKKTDETKKRVREERRPKRKLKVGPSFLLMDSMMSFS
jgi:hypothetical protein